MEQQNLLANAQSGLAQVLEKEGYDTEVLALAQTYLDIRECLRD
ncbi:MULTISPECIES: hypothetical protein [unclassified Nostoc]|nr:MULTISPECIES: hypothetical protein [unclassified Nostoc]